MYAPTAERPKEEADGFYDLLEQAKQQCKSQETVDVMGDWNAKAGSGRTGEAVGPFGLGTRNKRERFVEWCEANNMIIGYIWLRQHKRRLWTWKSAENKFRAQTDYIAINSRFRNALVKVRTYPGSDCGSDHVPVVAEVTVMLKKLERKTVTRKSNLDILKEDRGLEEQYAVEVKNIFVALRNREKNDRRTNMKGTSSCSYGRYREMCADKATESKAKINDGRHAAFDGEIL